MNLKGIILTAIIMLAPAAAGASDPAIYVERIEFRGIRNIDRYEVIKNSKAKVSEKGILINTDLLKQAMNSSIMIDNFDLDVKKNVLIVTVNEKYPLFMILRVEKSLSIPCLVDEKRNVLDTGRFFRTDMPIIIVEKDFFENENNGIFMKALFDNLVQIGKDKSSFREELSEIEVYRDGELRVKLKSRGTDFFIKNDLNGFRKIEKCAAYLDEINTYPGRLDLRDKRILIRQ